MCHVSVCDSSFDDMEVNECHSRVKYFRIRNINITRRVYNQLSMVYAWVSKSGLFVPTFLLYRPRERDFNVCHMAIPVYIYF